MQIFQITFDKIKHNIQLKINFYYLLIVIVGFQSFHTMARTIIPIKLLGSCNSGVAKYQFAACIGLFLGSYFVSSYLHNKYRRIIHPFSLIIYNAIAVVCTVHVNSLMTGLMTYAIFTFIFEVTAVKLLNEIMYHCPKQYVGLINSFLLSVLMAGMAVVVIVGGKMTDSIGIKNLSYIIVSVSILSSGIVLFLEKRTAFVYGNCSGPQ
jgi:predicted MFS family arabinose efflux permease